MEKKLMGYSMYDPIHNVNSPVDNFNPDILKAAYDRGMTFYAEYLDGTREKVAPEDIHDPGKAEQSAVVFIQPKYVNDRMDALFQIFEAFIEPLLVLLPSRYKAGIKEAMDNFKTLLQAGTELEEKTK